METIIKADPDIRWRPPVFVRIGNGFLQRIDGPKAALEALTHRRPSRWQPQYAAAKCRCADAMMHHGCEELVRTTFIDAAVPAKVLS
ncbi:DUF982 domain-containing protein [Rhizobium leguminosarum]|nr:DUF982 domain-containing protein [Rhizobium leguminosarum]RWY76346.1 DUF982 domain-containing protein [Rhizobium leguminosarum]